MRKIDKSQILSTEYKQWNDELECENRAHPKYNSSTGEYYQDIVMNLFHCQHGLCAYTERRLCPPDYYDISHWSNGRYNNKEKCEFFGQLDHFDNKLKSKKENNSGKQDWLWTNFFLIESDINTKVKGTKEVDYILKPDTTEYDEFILLDYNVSTHLYIANTNLDPDIQSRVNKMILVLGLNYGPVKDKRSRDLGNLLKQIQLGLIDWNYVPDEFPTAFAFCKKNSGKNLIK